MRAGILGRVSILGPGPNVARFASPRAGQLRCKSVASAPAERLTEQVKPNTSYPKHVWSPAGGWNTQPANWKSNTAICMVIMGGIMTLVWDYGSKREVRTSHVEFDRKKWREEREQSKKSQDH